MSNILLIEPDYKNKYPPLGLMKISYFHKHVLGDHVRFTKGRLPAALAEAKWDRVYVTSLFTFEWAKTIEAIQYAKTLVDSIDKITVGGIAATMLPQQIYEETGIRPVCGLLNEPGKLGLPGDECIDQIVPDYAILDDIDYVYPFHDAYFLSATKGCGNKCGFCAVQTLEPQYIPYIDLKQRIAAIEEEFGSKRDLLLMDNNVLRSPNFDQIIDDIIAAGFGKGATYLNPKTGKRVRRYVDFNQGLDALFFTEEKARRLGEIALRPARVAFDHIEDLPTYERALRLCAKHGITELSNYVLYNSEAFGGKGQQYAADTPADLYNRMRLTLDIKDDINRSLPEDRQVTAFSFPMRYIPLTAHQRGYVGSQWNAKFLRAVQCMLIPTQGKGVGSRSFFEADFGKNAEEFVRFLCMPDKLIAARGEFSLSGRGGEDPEALAARKAVWEKNQRKIREWNRLYQQLGDERTQFIALIGDNEFLPEKLLGAPSDLQKKLYLLYLTTPRTLALLGMVRSGSPTYDMLKGYVCSEFPDLYQDMVELLSTSEAQQQYMFQNFTQFFGRDGLADLLSALAPQDFRADRLLKKWHDACVKSGMGLVDFELIRVYTRYLDAEMLSPEERTAARRAILELDMPALAVLLNQRSRDFEAAVLASVAGEAGQELLNTTAQAIFRNIQCKLSQLLEA
ncbi:hypothetical protein [Flavonifractor sp. An306]|uniref:hypothetical protein n=1 Tax=Flavonifractor sp. An306 TaxID=1965629 RepID=UPI000B38CDEE|nr:hypothetical protein [Flavonifractor sp. An306]